VEGSCSGPSATPRSLHASSRRREKKKKVRHMKIGSASTANSGAGGQTQCQKRRKKKKRKNVGAHNTRKIGGLVPSISASGNPFQPTRKREKKKEKEGAGPQGLGCLTSTACASTSLSGDNRGGKRSNPGFVLNALGGSINVQRRTVVTGTKKRGRGKKKKGGYQAGEGCRATGRERCCP